VTGRVQLVIEDLRDAVSLVQIAEHLDQGLPCLFVFDGFKAVFLPHDLARDRFIGGVLIDAITPGKGLE
jgi:hypothetical protein